MPTTPAPPSDVHLRGRLGVVARHHHHLNTQGLELFDGGHRRVAHRIGDAHQAHGLSGHGHIKHGSGLAQQLLSMGRQLGREVNALFS